MTSGQVDGQTGTVPLPPRADLTPDILTVIGESTKRVTGLIHEAQALSEREILACGNVLSSIVDNAKQLAEESDHAMASTMARSEEMAARFIQGMREDILAQESAVQKVLDHAGRIEEAIAAINDLTMSSRLLAINARIEAARLGAHGRGFTVIADNLNGLSNVIRQASDKVGSAIDAVRQGLPPVKARAASMNERTKSFVEEVSTQVKSASLQSEPGQSSGKLAKLMELSNEALSHLQFQDPMAQKLQSIVGDLDASAERIRRTLSGEDGSEAKFVDQAVDFDQPVSGEIMLF